ncbi:MAG: hypothetical protein HG456_003325 [candidate division SR1 bacterium]|nr:hypothetical protein [candidate division SR1 bacterium]
MNNKILLSTDTMVGYGLDMIFEMAKNADMMELIWLFQRGLMHGMKTM